MKFIMVSYQVHTKTFELNLFYTHNQRHNCFVLFSVSAFLIILAVIIYGSASQDEDATSLYNLSWSYALCTASGLLYIPLSCIILSTKDVR